MKGVQKNAFFSFLNGIKLLYFLFNFKSSAHQIKAVGRHSFIYGFYDIVKKAKRFTFQCPSVIYHPILKLCMSNYSYGSDNSIFYSESTSRNFCKVF